MAGADSFKLTYSTMFDPPPELHQRFDAALAAFRQDGMGKAYPHWIGGRAVEGCTHFEGRSPIDTDWLLGRYAQGDALIQFWLHAEPPNELDQWAAEVRKAVWMERRWFEALGHAINGKPK